MLCRSVLLMGMPAHPESQAQAVHVVHASRMEGVECVGTKLRTGEDLVLHVAHDGRKALGLPRRDGGQQRAQVPGVDL